MQYFAFTEGSGYEYYCLAIDCDRHMITAQPISAGIIDFLWGSTKMIHILSNSKGKTRFIVIQNCIKYVPVLSSFIIVRRTELLGHYPDAIGLDMEGEGMRDLLCYITCNNSHRCVDARVKHAWRTRSQC